MRPRFCFAVGLLLACVCPRGAAQAQEARPPGAPLILVHYMAWFQAKPYSGAWGWHWTMNRFNPDLQDASGHPQIASHFHPLAGPYDSRDPRVLEYHALLMKVAGVDGAIVDWYGSDALYDYAAINEGTERLFEALKTAGLRFALCYEDNAINQFVSAGRVPSAAAADRARAHLSYADARWMADSTYLTLQGRPVVLNFGPQRFRTSAEWEGIFSGMRMPPLFFSEDLRISPAASGAYPWPPMWASVNGVLTQARLGQYLDEFYGRAASWPVRMGGAFPGFQDIYAQAGVRASYGFLDARDGRTFAETLGRALDAGPALVQVATWNDFGEGTSIEPSHEYGYRYLEHLQQTVRGYRPLPYSAEDLRLPVRLYDLRKTHAADAGVMRRLDEAATHLAAGRPARARALLDAPTASEAARAPDRKAVIRTYPSPVTEVVTLQVDLPEPGAARLEIYDVHGRRVAVLAEGVLAAGVHTFTWNTVGQPGGLHFYRLIGASRAGGTLVVRP